MLTVISVSYALTLVLLVLILGVRPARTTLSRFELERRAKHGDARMKAELRRENLLHDVYSLQHVLTALLLVTLSALGVLLFHWLTGFVIAILVALEAGAIAKLRPIRRLADRLYVRVEPALLRLIENHQRIFRLLRTVAPLQSEPYILQSREELQEVLTNALPAALNDQEKQLVRSTLQFEKRTVAEIMTPRNQLDTVGRKELLGPLVLDELHKTGHSRFPVIDHDLDTVIGILHIGNLLNLDVRRSVTAEKAMDPHVNFIRHDQTLAHALAAFLRTRHHLFIVIDDHQRTRGVLSLEDVMEALLGRKLYDEFEEDDSPRVVAGRTW